MGSRLLAVLRETADKVAFAVNNRSGSSLRARGRACPAA